jgi:hypothetical protein
LLVCGQIDAFDPPAVAALRRASAVPLHVHRLTATPGADAIEDPAGTLLRRLGVRDAAVYLIRPDGYVGYRSAGTDLAGLPGYL